MAPNAAAGCGEPSGGKSRTCSCPSTPSRDNGMVEQLVQHAGDEASVLVDIHKRLCQLSQRNIHRVPRRTHSALRILRQHLLTVPQMTILLSVPRYCRFAGA